MHLTRPRCERRGDLRCCIERLGGLPLRPTTARAILASHPDEPADSLALAVDSESPELRLVETDPGWVLGRWLVAGLDDALELIADRPWWPSLSGAAAGAIQRLWRHGVAVSCAARRLAHEAGDPNPELLARVGLVHNLGYWALAAAAPARLATLLALSDPIERRAQERAWLGTDAAELGRTLAEAWNADQNLVDAVWLHADVEYGLNKCSQDPDRLGLVQRAYSWAERTPWALFPPELGEPGAPDPRLRVLMAEVQARCGGTFVEAASSHEETLARSHARLRLQVRQLLREREAQDRFLETLAASDPTSSPPGWAVEAGQAWSSAPGVTAASVIWTDNDSREPVEETASVEATRDESQADQGPPNEIVPLGKPRRQVAEVHLWRDQEGPALAWSQDPLRAAWGSWAAQVAEHGRLARRLDAVMEAHRRRVDGEEPARRAARLDALAEFAAGAGHELNNPLAVILGRAQLLLSRHREPELERSLRAIVVQARRAHRILRDLMYVARPPAPRPRPCQPDEILRSCVRDLQEEAQARGITLAAEVRDPAPLVWADPDPMRHLAETLVRNALEATPAGGTIHIRTAGDPRQLSWTIQDTGRGLSPTEAEHLFNPFFCGRQAGRGLGLGLPRVARFLSQIGGQIRWRSWPGRGTVFHITVPLLSPPAVEGSNGAASCA